MTIRSLVVGDEGISKYVLVVEHDLAVLDYLSGAYLYVYIWMCIYACVYYSRPIVLYDVGAIELCYSILLV